MKVADTRKFVLDASVTAAWCFEDEGTKLAENVLESLSKGSEALVPSLWPFLPGGATNVTFGCALSVS